MVSLGISFFCSSQFMAQEEIDPAVLNYLAYLDALNSGMDSDDEKKILKHMEFLDYAKENASPNGIPMAMSHVVEYYGMRDMTSDAFKLLYTNSRQLNKAQDKKAVSELEMKIAHLYLILGEYEEATSRFNTAGEYFKSTQDSAGIAAYNMNASLVYADLGQTQKAIGCMKKSIEIDSLLGNKKALGAAYHNLGLLYVNEGSDNKKAVYYLEQAMHFSNLYKNDIYKSRHLHALADIFVQREDYDAASDYILESLSISDKVGDFGARVSGLMLLGEIYMKSIHASQAIHPLETALELSKKETEIHTVREIHRLLVEAHTALGNQDIVANHQEIIKTLDERIAKQTPQALKNMY